MKVLVLNVWIRLNFDAFLRPNTLKNEKNLRVGYLYKEKSFNTIFSFFEGRRVEGTTPPPPHRLWVSKSLEG